MKVALFFVVLSLVFYLLLYGLSRRGQRLALKGMRQLAVAALLAAAVVAALVFLSLHSAIKVI